MKVPVIKKIAATYTMADLEAAEQAILNEEAPLIPIEGDDEGERLTHILAAREILIQMKNEGIDLNKAMRNYSQRVRNSIS